MDVEFDSAKNTENPRKHGISLKRAVKFDLSSSKLTFDDREDYGEERYRAVGFLDAKLYVLIFTVRDTTLSAISLRKANREEAEEYAERH